MLLFGQGSITETASTCEPASNQWPCFQQDERREKSEFRLTGEEGERAALQPVVSCARFMALGRFLPERSSFKSTAVLIHD